MEAVGPLVVRDSDLAQDPRKTRGPPCYPPIPLAALTCGSYFENSVSFHRGQHSIVSTSLTQHFGSLFRSLRGTGAEACGSCVALIADVWHCRHDPDLAVELSDLGKLTKVPLLRWFGFDGSNDHVGRYVVRAQVCRVSGSMGRFWLTGDSENRSNGFHIPGFTCAGFLELCVCP